MLRGNLDPATLPRHPEDTVDDYPREILQHASTPNNAATETPRPNMYPVVPAQQADSSHPPQATIMVPMAHAPGQSKDQDMQSFVDDGQSEADYEVVDASSLPPAATNGVTHARPTISRPYMHTSSPSPSPYATRSVDGDGSVSTAGVAGVKKQRVQRTSSRDERLHLDDDDLPENNQALATSPLATSFPYSGRLRPSLDNTDLQSSTLGSPSFARHPDASDITPFLQDLPHPQRPTIVPQHSPIYSNVASVTEGGSPATGSEFFTPFEGSTSTLRVPQVQPSASPAMVQPEEERKQVRFQSTTAQAETQSKGRRGIFFRQRSGLRDK